MKNLPPPLDNLLLILRLRMLVPKRQDLHSSCSLGESGVGIKYSQNSQMSNYHNSRRAVP